MFQEKIIVLERDIFSNFRRQIPKKERNPSKIMRLFYNILRYLLPIKKYTRQNTLQQFFFKSLYPTVGPEF